MKISVYVCQHVNLHAYVHACVSLCVGMCIFASLCAGVYVCLFERVRVCEYVLSALH